MRPARPACCHRDARVPGQPASSTASSPLTSMPSSRAFVAARPRRAPERRRCSSSRRSSGRYPPRYAAMAVPRAGSTWLSDRRALAATVSTPARDRANATVCTPSTTRSAKRSPVSATALRRCGASSLPPPPGTRPGSHRPNVIDSRGDPSWVTDRTGIPIRALAWVCGSATVALARMNVGEDP